MENFYNLILKLENDDTIECAEYLDQNIPIVSEISYLADDLLINESHCDWRNIHWLEDKGISVFPIERDGFGWLVGGISTKKGVIAYG